MKLFRLFKNRKLNDELDKAYHELIRLSFENMDQKEEIKKLKIMNSFIEQGHLTTLRENIQTLKKGCLDREKEINAFRNKVDRLRNEVSHQKAEKKKIMQENRRIKDSNAQLVGEKMQLRKELNRYKDRLWWYEIT